jgi:hypothetical protein
MHMFLASSRAMRLSRVECWYNNVCFLLTSAAKGIPYRRPPDLSSPSSHRLALPFDEACTDPLFPTESTMWASPVLAARLANASDMPSGVSDAIMASCLRSSAIFLRRFSVFMRPDVLPLKGGSISMRRVETRRNGGDRWNSGDTYWNLCERDFQASFGVISAITHQLNTPTEDHSAKAGQSLNGGRNNTYSVQTRRGRQC